MRDEITQKIFKRCAPSIREQTSLRAIISRWYNTVNCSNDYTATIMANESSAAKLLFLLFDELQNYRLWVQ